LNFSTLAEAYERIEATSKRLEMTELLANLLGMTSAKVIDKVVYLTQGKLYPDYLGIELGIAERLAIKVLSGVTGRSESEIERTYKRIGDMGASAEALMIKRSQQTLTKSQLSVERVYETFEKIAKATGEGSLEQKVRLLASLISDASPREAKYILRMALGKLRLGVADMTVLDALAKAYGGDKESRVDLERAYNLSSDLGYVAKIVATDGMRGIKKFRVVVGRPIRPMLCERLSSAEEILTKLGGKGAAEYKYDGLRVQAHVEPKGVALFSRRLENITSQFPDVCHELRRATNIKEAILEGECVGMDMDTGDMLPFQMISQRRGRKYEIEKMIEEIPVTIFLFDILYADGDDLTQRPYMERRKLLEKAVKETDRVRIAEQITTSSPDKLEKYFDEAVSMGCEGLVVKNISNDSIYQAGARGWLWIKYKRSYKAEVADTFDLVPVGAFHGRGKRAGTYGALLMATYNKDSDSFETLCKLGSGFTDEDLERLPKLLKDFIIPHKHARVNSLMKSDVWFSPATVLEISADEITLSPLHTCARDKIRMDRGLALRFPRFTGRYRTDKSPEDSTTSKELLEMYKRQLKKIEVEKAV